MKRGLSTLEMLGAMLLLLVVLGIAIAWYYQFFGNAEDALEGFTDCGQGVITSGLAQYGQGQKGAYGKCSTDKSCGDMTPDKDGDVGYYYQYIGQGWGCPGCKEGERMSDGSLCNVKAEYCCLRMPEGSNPVNFRDIRSAARTQMEEGELLFNIEGTNTHINVMRDNSVDLVVKLEEPFDFTYRPKSLDTGCELEIRLNNELKGIKITNTACNYPNEAGIIELGPDKGFINSVMDNNLAPPLGKGTMTEQQFLESIERIKIPGKQRIEATLIFTAASGVSASRIIYITT